MLLAMTSFSSNLLLECLMHIMHGLTLGVDLSSNEQTRSADFLLSKEQANQGLEVARASQRSHHCRVRAQIRCPAHFTWLSDETCVRKLSLTPIMTAGVLTQHSSTKLITQEPGHDHGDALHPACYRH